jgi:hypothetical protein
VNRGHPRLSYANVVATLALVLALGGGAYAAIRLPRNSVRSRNIVNGQVQSADVKDNGLTGQDVKDDSLTGKDINESTLSLPKGSDTQKLIYLHDSSSALSTIATIGPWELKAECDISGSALLALDESGPATTLANQGLISSDDTSIVPYTHTDDFPAGTYTIISPSAASGHFKRSTGTFFLRSGSTLARVDYHAIAGGTSTRCQLYGTAELIQ